MQRYVGFKEALVDLDDEAPGSVARQVGARLFLAEGEGPFAVEATWAERDGLFVTAARIRLKS